MKHVLFSLIFVFSTSLWAQSPPPLNPYDSPWGEPVTKDSGSSGNTSAPSPSDPFGSPFDSPSMEDDFGGFSPGNGSSSKDSGEGKSSFMLVAPSNIDECKSWGNSMIANKSFSDFNDCQFQLERKLEQARSAIEISDDTIERYKLKKMLRGEITNEERKQNSMRFSVLEKRIKRETKKGCSCIKK